MMAEAFMRQSLTYWSPSRPAAHKKRLAVKIAIPIARRSTGDPNQAVLLARIHGHGCAFPYADDSDIIAAWLLLTAAGPRRFCTGLLY